MAEALAAVGVAASIAQLLELGFKVTQRLRDFRSKVDAVPKCFEHLDTQLPLLLDTLKGTETDIGNGVIAHDTERALLPVVNACRLQIESLDTVITKLLPRSNDGWLKKNKKALSSLFQEDKVDSIGQAISSYVQTLTFYHSAAKSTLNPAKDARLIKIRAWLSAPDPSVNYQKGMKLRLADTGLWFIEGQAYSKWKEEPASIIWLHGIPGCGKTILSSTVIEDTLQHCEHDPGKAIAYFYFDFKDSQKQSPQLMIKSLITQLSQKCVRIPPQLDSLFASSNSGQWQPSESGLLNALQQMLEELPATYFVLDALDECKEREDLLTAIEAIVGWGLPNLHIMLTSRKEHDIEDSLTKVVEPSNVVPLQSSIVDEDIRKYVSHRLSVDKALRKWHGGEMQSEIEAALMGGAHGMFRWAVCQLDTLGSCVSKAMLRKALKRLPPTLDETYERILCSVHEDHATQALRILQWLAFSVRPLYLDQLAEIVAIDPDRCPSFDRDEVLEDPADALRICSSLITVSSLEVDHYRNFPDRYSAYGSNWLHLEEPESDSDQSVSSLHSDNRQMGASSDNDESAMSEAVNVRGEYPGAYVEVSLAHFSVKEYLLSERIWKGPAKGYGLSEKTCHALLAKSCVGYLLQFDGKEPLSAEEVSVHRLARYSAQQWMEHLQLCENGDLTARRSAEDLAVKLLVNSTGACRNWIRIFDADEGVNHPASYINPLYLASRYALTGLCHDMLQNKGFDVNVQGGYWGNPLQAAVVSRNASTAATTKLLLDAGANVNATGGFYNSALAAAGGHLVEDDRVLSLLLQAGANVNAQCKHLGIVAFGAPLYFAVCCGRQGAVKLLIEAGANVNAQNAICESTLIMATSGDVQDMARLILEIEADCAAQAVQHWTALMVAVFWDHGNTANLLIEAGADVNAHDAHHRTALMMAASRDMKSTARLLIEARADVNAHDARHRTALMMAASTGSEDVVRLLIAAGADVNAQSGEKTNALAAVGLSIIDIHLGDGMAMDSGVVKDAVALVAAASHHKEDAQKILFDIKSLINLARSKSHWRIRSLSGLTEVVKLLLDAGARVKPLGSNEDFVSLLERMGIPGYMFC